MHIYQGHPFIHLTIDLWNITRANNLTYSRMHTYQGPLLELTIDLWNTTTQIHLTYSTIHIY